MPKLRLTVIADSTNARDRALLKTLGQLQPAGVDVIEEFVYSTAEQQLRFPTELSKVQDDGEDLHILEFAVVLNPFLEHLISAAPGVVEFLST